jgi:hypothetical protein
MAERQREVELEVETSEGVQASSQNWLASTGPPSPPVGSLVAGGGIVLLFGLSLLGRATSARPLHAPLEPSTPHTKRQPRHRHRRREP